MSSDGSGATCACATSEQTGTRNGYMCEWRREKYVAAVGEQRALVALLEDALHYIAGCGSETAMPLMDSRQTALWFINYAKKAIARLDAARVDAEKT